MIRRPVLHYICKLFTSGDIYPCGVIYSAEHVLHTDHISTLFVGFQYKHSDASLLPTTHAHCCITHYTCVKPMDWSPSRHQSSCFDHVFCIPGWASLSWDTGMYNPKKESGTCIWSPASYYQFGKRQTRTTRGDHFSFLFLKCHGVSITNLFCKSCRIKSHMCTRTITSVPECYSPHQHCKATTTLPSQETTISA
jgi:hypothetical protein